jgi:hypothetical protein
MPILDIEFDATSPGLPPVARFPRATPDKLEALAVTGFLTKIFSHSFTHSFIYLFKITVSKIFPNLAINVYCIGVLNP